MEPEKTDEGAGDTESEPARGKPKQRLVVLSNRLPVQRVEVDSEGDGDSWRLSPGGLVSALQPILANRGGSWIGWPGVAKSALDADRPDASFSYEGVDLHPVAISADEMEGYYDGFCNRTLWPLYHDSIRLPSYRRSWWDAFVAVNRRFADAALEVAGPDGVIWVHDYQLQLVPGFIRDRAPRARIGFFLHIPFPPLELFAQMPWRRELLAGLLGADVIGFQTRDGARNFEQAAQDLTPVRRQDPGTLVWGDRLAHTGVFPISIDVARFEGLARRPETRARAEQIRAALGGRKIVLGVDRLDYSKGIDRRLQVFETMLECGRVRAEDVALLQIAVPTRQEVPEYVALRRSVEQLAGRINGRFGKPGRAPVHCLCTSVPIEDLTATYMAADVMAVTPFRDGMNLVAKEFVAARCDHAGTLVLSEFAGAAKELRHAFLVNPHDEDALADALERAIWLPAAEAEQRMRAMRAQVRRHDVYDWADSFLGTLTSLATSRRASRALVHGPTPGEREGHAVVRSLRTLSTR